MESAVDLPKATVQKILKILIFMLSTQLETSINEGIMKTILRWALENISVNIIIQIAFET